MRDGQKDDEEKKEVTSKEGCLCDKMHNIKSAYVEIHNIVQLTAEQGIQFIAQMWPDIRDAYSHELDEIRLELCKERGE